MAEERETQVWADMEFTDISMEKNRAYCCANGTTLQIAKPLWLHVKKEGDKVSHRIVAMDPDEKNVYLCYWIDPYSGLVIQWTVSMEHEPFVY